MIPSCLAMKARTTMVTPMLLSCLVKMWVATQAFLLPPTLSPRCLAAVGEAQQHAQARTIYDAPKRTWRPRCCHSSISMSTIASARARADAENGVETRIWKWGGYNIRYKVAGEVRTTSALRSTAVISNWAWKNLCGPRVSKRRSIMDASGVGSN